MLHLDSLSYILQQERGGSHDGEVFAAWESYVCNRTDTKAWNIGNIVSAVQLN